MIAVSAGLGIVVGLLPAVMLAGGALVCAVVATARPRTRASLYRWLTLLATIGAFTASMIELVAIRPNRDGVGSASYAGALMIDRFHVFGTVLVCLVLILTVIGAEAYMRRAPTRAGAFCALLQVSAAASVMLLAQREMAAFTAAFALLVVSLVLLTAMTKTSEQTAEAAFKQVLMGGVAMATAVYGLVLLYAATGTTDLSRLAVGVGVNGAPVDGPLAAVGIALVVAGLLLVAGAPPLQAWTRQLQETAPGAIAGFGSGLGVVTGTAVLARFAVEAFGAGNSRWTLLVTWLAAIAMLLGGVLALRATTMRRLIADLSVAQAGFLLLAVASTGRGLDGNSTAAPTALLFTLMGAAAALVAAMLLTGIFDTAGLPPGIEAHRGVGRRAPATAAFLTIALLGLAGLPPMAGFFGRLLIAESALNAGAGWAVGIAGVAMVLCALGVLRWLVAMYAEDNGEAPFAVRTTPMAARAAAWSAAGLGLLIAAFAGPLISLAGGGATALHSMPAAKGPPSGYLGITRRPSRREWRRALILFAVGMVGLILVVLFIRPQPNLLPVGAAAPAISLDAAAGGHVDVTAAAAGRPYIVEFFEAGCAHCQQVAAQLCAEAVPVFAVDAAKDSAATVTSYRNQYAGRCSYPMLLDPNLSAGSAYSVNVVPTVYVVKDGKVAYAGAGLDGVSGLGAAVRKAVGG